MGSVLILALKGCGHLNIRLFLLLIPLLVHVSFVSANSELYQSLSGDESTVNHECVVLLHGLARGSGSMVLIEERLLAEGYGVSNVDYPSRQHPIETLSNLAIQQGLADCGRQSAETIHFVTHSLGGILVRQYFKQNKRQDFSFEPGRVVMLGPPNQGSEVVDVLKSIPGFELINGPAGMQLGTGVSDIPRQLGAVDFELGVIAGTQSINLFLSLFLPSPDDGKVSVVATKVQGMTDFITLPTQHPFMMRSKTVIEQTVHFLKYGAFFKEAS